MNQAPRGFYIPPSALSLACLALLTVSIVVAQDRTTPGQSNSTSTRPPHVATVRSSQSSEGSRVAITSDQSLNNYEAYRRGDRFYVKIPAADVSRAESARGRGFADVKSQRSGDSTVLSFRLDPGASAHVEQRGNNLDVVVSVPGGTSYNAAANGDNSRPAISDPSRGGDVNQRGKPKSNNSATGAKSDGGLPANSANGNPNEGSPRDTNTSPPASSSSASSTVTAPGNATPQTAEQTPGSAGALTTSPASGPSSSPITNTAAGPAAAAPPAALADFWARVKERTHYWLLLAQLNPIPVALGAMLLVFIVILLLFQWRRAKSTRRVKTATKSTGTYMAAAAEPASRNGTETAVRAQTATLVAHRRSLGAKKSLPVSVPAEPTTTTRATATAPAATSHPEDGRRERMSRAGEEAKKILAGDRYDESYVGSEDPETRRLVGAELLSALVGRNTVRRERARAAFMKHGYFDDATRDLRIGASENERAAAARRLSFINDREATPHLIGALSDPSPDVRRAAVEALMDVRDPAAIAALDALLQNEKDRKVPRHLIQNAIEACATNPEPRMPAGSGTPPAQIPPPAPTNPDREVIEI